MAGEQAEEMEKLLHAANHAAFVLRHPHMEREHRLYAAELLDEALAAFDREEHRRIPDEAWSDEALPAGRSGRLQEGQPPMVRRHRPRDLHRLRQVRAVRVLLSPLVSEGVFRWMT